MMIPTKKIEEPEEQIFETKLGEIEREPKGQHLSKDEIEKKAKELAQERWIVEKSEAERQRLEEEIKELKEQLVSLAIPLLFNNTRDTKRNPDCSKLHRADRSHSEYRKARSRAAKKAADTRRRNAKKK